MSPFVAASDAPEPDKQKADFRCDGISDNVENQAAIDLATSTFKARNKDSALTSDITAYLAAKSQQIEERLVKAIHFVALAKENGDTFSDELASILRDAGSAFASSMDELVRITAVKPKKKYDFADYRAFLVNNIPNIHRRVVAVSPMYPLVIMPFSAFADCHKGQPKWWKAYTVVKHSEITQHKEGNLANAVGAAAALAVLGNQMGAFVRTSLFVNVGVVYPPEDPAIQSERVLFDVGD